MIFPLSNPVGVCAAMTRAADLSTFSSYGLCLSLADSSSEALRCSINSPEPLTIRTLASVLDPDLRAPASLLARVGSKQLRRSRG